MQPYYRQQVEGATAFVRLEQENRRLTAALDQMARKCPLLVYVLLFFCITLVSYLAGSFRLSPVDCDKAVNRVAELEKALESESAKSKKLLDEAEQREIELMQAEKVEISWLLSLASHVGGK